MMPPEFFDHEKFREFLLSLDVDDSFPDGSRGGSCPLGFYAKSLVTYAYVGIADVMYDPYLVKSDELLPWQREYSMAACDYSEQREDDGEGPAIARDAAIHLLDVVLHDLEYA